MTELSMTITNDHRAALDAARPAWHNPRQWRTIQTNTISNTNDILLCSGRIAWREKGCVPLVTVDVIANVAERETIWIQKHTALRYWRPAGRRTWVWRWHAIDTGTDRYCTRQNILIACYVLNSYWQLTRHLVLSVCTWVEACKIEVARDSCWRWHTNHELHAGAWLVSLSTHTIVMTFAHCAHAHSSCRILFHYLHACERLIVNWAHTWLSWCRRCDKRNCIHNVIRLITVSAMHGRRGRRRQVMSPAQVIVS